MRFHLHDERTTAATLLNPDAGSHAIPTDFREIAAALRAGERTWGRFPYYEERYGERGRRFTASDSAWLVTLASLPEPQVRAQVEWLGAILAGRGMPRWLLERHLVTLHAALVRAVPERAAAYAVLQGAARHLRALREAHVAGTVQARLAAAFDARIDPAWRRRLPHTGALLVAAVADERAGIARAVSSLESWMADPVRFPPPWIAAVRATLQAARES